MDAWVLLAEPRRRRLIELCRDGERTVTELHRAMPEITIGAVSQHLARLRDAGILVVRAEGRRRWYRADAARLEELRRSLDTMWVAGLDRLASLASDTSPGEPDAAGRRRGGG